MHVKPQDDYTQTINIKNTPMIDMHNRDEGLNRINVQNIPYNNTHIGAFVYYASLITAIGRT